MVHKKLKIFIVLTLIITLVFIFSPISLSNRATCKCGGCCIGCPGDCNSIGTPLAYYYWGVNGASGEMINQLSVLGLIIDIIAFSILIFLIYKWIYKKKSVVKLKKL